MTNAQRAREGIGDLLGDLDDGLGGGRDPAQEFDRVSVDELLARLPDTDESRPALQKLSSDQRDALASFVDGFDDRQAWLRWSQKATIATLGELDDDWFVERSFSRLDMSTLIVSKRRFAWADHGEEGVDPLDAEEALIARRAVAAIDLLPAMTAAYRRLRWAAVEYVNDHDDQLRPDSEVQKHPAMRPALSEMAERQAWALGELLDGFATDDALLAWLQAINEASYAEVNDTLATRAYVERHTRRMLVVEGGEASKAPFFRESLAALELLPAYNRAARKVADRSGELVEAEKKEITENLI